MQFWGTMMQFYKTSKSTWGKELQLQLRSDSQPQNWPIEFHYYVPANNITRKELRQLNPFWHIHQDRSNLYLSSYRVQQREITASVTKIKGKSSYSSSR